ncbi:hypothetical protein AXK11_05200 [Cephaloticoccus primus]|uniref:Uncharacterized protein n=1 Tax=Cephaloticoccus primus TaxID=1548207 RepID=A0A139SMU5_9BACT|nr:hypothetical protein AXK11_05200 [Cephaloticoccus primus]
MTKWGGGAAVHRSVWHAWPGNNERCRARLPHPLKKIAVRHRAPVKGLLAPAPTALLLRV